MVLINWLIDIAELARSVYFWIYMWINMLHAT